MLIGRTHMSLLTRSDCEWDDKDLQQVLIKWVKLSLSTTCFLYRSSIQSRHSNRKS